MADADRQDAAEAIKIFVALIVPDIFALTLNKRNRLLVIGGNRRKKKFFMFPNRLGNCGFLFCLIHIFILPRIGAD